MSEPYLGKKLKSELHHWWPKSLSAFWAADDGCVSQLSSSGAISRSPPDNFGAIKNAHHIKLSEVNPWNSSFEHKFGSADSGVPHLVAWLMRLEAKSLKETSELSERLTAIDFAKEDRKRLAECMSSLIVRSPNSRDRTRRTVEYYRKKFGMKDYEADKTLIASNISGQHDSFVKEFLSGGKYVVLISDSKELIWGDGFLHNFPTNPDRPLAPRCVINLLPTIAIAFFRPTGVYRTFPELFTLKVSEREVECLNYFVQVYSGKYLYFRNDKPRTIDDFSADKHLEFQYHKHPWLDLLFQTALDFR